MKAIGIIKKLGETLPRHSLVVIYKPFVRPHLDHGDIISAQTNNESFTQKTERIQYNAALAITGTIKGTSQNRLYSKLGFKSRKCRRWFRKLCTFIKIKTTSIPEYLFDITQTNHLQNTHLSEDVTLLFAIYIIRMGQTRQENITVYNYADFQKCLIKDWSTYF